MKTAHLIASGDLRLSANQKCWPAQAAMDVPAVDAIEREGWPVRRAHPFDPKKKHVFSDSQKYRMEVFTEAQVLDQCKMYVASVRMADEFGCATIGIQYQQGFKELTPASYPVEGTHGLFAKAAAMRELGLEVSVCGEV